MALEPPQPGQVISYPYLWHREHRAGEDVARKIRPTVVLYTRENAGRTRVYLLPVTTSAPQEPGVAMEIPWGVKQHLGLHADRSWIRVDELNEFEWPGADLRARSTDALSRGFLPERMVEHLRVMARERNLAKRVDRDIDTQAILQALRPASRVAKGAAGTATAAAVVDESRRLSRQAWEQHYIGPGTRETEGGTLRGEPTQDRDLGR